jgi:hypothetical protein
MKGKWKLALAAASLALISIAPRLRAQDISTITKTTTLWVDERTGQVFIRPGRGRVPMTIGSPVDAAKIERQIEDSANAKVQAAVSQAQEEQRLKDQQLAKKVEEMRPAWQSYVANWQDKFRIGTLFFGDYRFYPLTGFQPQELENINNPGPGNDLFNSFDISRIYTNVFFFPTKDWLFRFTPELYKTNGCSSSNAACANTYGNTAKGSNSYASNLDGNLGLRLKYAYLQYQGLWNNVPTLKGGTISAGSLANPFIPWQEDLYGYRFVNLVPWNYLGFSSGQLGVQMEGPVKLFGGEKNYLDYGFGVYNNANFHQFEQSDTKQAMVRGSIYPFGAEWRYQGLGLTGFYNYGWGNTTPDNSGVPTTLKQTSAHYNRIAALIHYSEPLWNLAGEFDYGQNAVSLGNMFSGSGPSDAFGTASGPSISSNNVHSQLLTGAPLTGKLSCSSTTPCYDVFGSYGPQTAVYRAILQNGRARNIGADFFGHFNIPYTKFSVFGMFQWFMPNDNITKNPLDFQRFVVGVSYQLNEYVRFAIDSQNISYYHNQFGIPVGTAEQFGYTTSTFNGRQVPSLKNFVIPNLVPTDTHSVFANLEFAY